MKLELPNISLCIVDTLNYSKCITALRQSMKDINFGEVLIFIEIDRLDNTIDYSQYITKQLPKHVNLDYVLIIQWDGYVIDMRNWQESFLDYDYIGAEWAPKHWNNYTKNLMGNGGFSLRSKKLMDIVMKDNLIDIKGNEDAYICYYYKKYLESYGIKYAPVQIARQFSFEEIKMDKTFGFHGVSNLNKIK